MDSESQNAPINVTVSLFGKFFCQFCYFGCSNLSSQFKLAVKTPKNSLGPNGANNMLYCSYVYFCLPVCILQRLTIDIEIFVSTHINNRLS